MRGVRGFVVFVRRGQPGEVCEGGSWRLYGGDSRGGRGVRGGVVLVRRG